MFGFKELLILGVIAVIAAVFLLPVWKSRSGAKGVKMDSQNEFQKVSRIVITDIDIPFWDIVQLMVKWAIAAIPALLILAFLFALLTGLFAGMV